MIYLYRVYVLSNIAFKEAGHRWLTMVEAGTWPSERKLDSTRLAHIDNVGGRALDGCRDTPVGGARVAALAG
jgi:hypothetical protein